MNALMGVVRMFSKVELTWCSVLQVIDPAQFSSCLQFGSTPYIVKARRKHRTIYIVLGIDTVGLNLKKHIETNWLFI
jgi:hypothetical protein